MDVYVYIPEEKVQYKALDASLSTFKPICLTFPNDSKKLPLRHFKSLNFQVSSGISKKEVKECNISKLIKSAVDSYMRGKINVAFGKLADLIDLGVSHADVFYLFGEISRIKDLTEQAEKYLVKAMRFAVHSPNVYFSMGMLKASQGNYKEAASFLKHYAKLNNTSEEHLANILSSPKGKLHVSRLH